MGKRYAPDNITGELKPNRRLQQLYDKVVSAFSIGYVGCLDFNGHRRHPHNMAAHPEFAAFAALAYPRAASGLLSKARSMSLCFEGILPRDDWTPAHVLDVVPVWLWFVRCVTQLT